MYWEKIEGFFNFDNIYTDMVKRFDDAVFVEIGSWKGRSTVYMAEEIKKYNKNISWYAVDMFKGTKDENDNDKDVINDTLYDKYLKNIEPVKDLIHTIRGDSKEVYKQFEDESIDFLFIDGDHTYKGCYTDIKNWFPKVKKGGIIGGHDYSEPTCGVKMAVDSYFLFSKKIKQDRTSWLYHK